MDRPVRIQELAWLAIEDPRHPSRHLKPLRIGRRARFRRNSGSGRVTLSYRIVAKRLPNGVLAWYWVGSHADYDRMLGK